MQQAIKLAHELLKAIGELTVAINGLTEELRTNARH
jgi:hypothetical protein